LPLILCALEGRTVDEAARQLGWTPGSVRGRLVRGRQRLHAGLVRRGMTLAAALAGLTAAQGGVSGGLPGRVGEGMTRAAGGCVAAKEAGGASGGGVSAKVVALAEGMLEGMALAKLKVGLVLALAVGTLAVGAGLAAHRVLAGKEPKPEQVAEAKVE